MDTKYGSGRINNTNQDDVQTHKQQQSDLQTLAELAAKVAARFSVNTDVRTDSRIMTVVAQTATILTPVENVAITSITTPPTNNKVISISQANVDHQAPENIDKPLSQKSDDSDFTLQAEQSERNALQQRVAQTLNDKRYSDEQTLDRILLAHSEQLITTGCLELDCTSNAAGVPGLAIQSTNASAGGGGVGVTAADAMVGTKRNFNAAIANVTENERGCSASGEGAARFGTPSGSIRSIGSLVCRICHNSENPERLVSPCLCKGSLTYVHVHCLERWISTSRSTVCELCQFQYNTVQTLRYTCFQSLRMWYSRSMSRRALQEDCQMFSLLTLVAFGIIGTLLVGIQYYVLQGRSWGLSRVWTKGWLIFFLFTTLTIYFINIYMILKAQLGPWYRWWQSARDIKLILENRKPFQLSSSRRLEGHQLAQELTDMVQLQQHGIVAPPSIQTPQANNTPPPSTLYQPNHTIQPTTAAISIPIHIRNLPVLPIPICPTNTPTTHLPITISTIELQCIANNNNNNTFVANATNTDDDALSCCGKRSMSLVMATCESGAAAMHCNKLTTAAAIEIPLKSCLYEFETVI
ncbi:uncharacterized protein [Eurosta solidaginis]|uniref:uncharacterized protein n=1 Tax=Eurosta solidaginis TaxID=178769 RepID=UPI0035306EEF